MAEARPPLPPRMALAWGLASRPSRGPKRALTGMMRDGEIDRPRAEALARMVLRENAAKLYGTSVASR